MAERVGFEPTVRFAWWITRRPARLVWWTAPVSHQKRPLRNATNAINLQRKYNKINEAGRYPAAHNGLVAGSSPGEPFTISMADHLQDRKSTRLNSSHRCISY